jgi:hypothetical protein
LNASSASGTYSPSIQYTQLRRSEVRLFTRLSARKFPAFLRTAGAAAKAGDAMATPAAAAPRNARRDRTGVADSALVIFTALVFLL